jgi:uncharacterized Fe-S center protein
MAGAGYKLFATGDVLTAAQVNTYLMQQSVMVFASSAARTSAISGILAEGMVTYLQDTNSLEYYNGSAWVASGNVSLTGVETLTNKTLTAPIVTDAILRGTEEDVNVVASAATGTINFDVSTASIWYYTSNASANHTLNFRYSSGDTLASKLAVGDAIT